MEYIFDTHAHYDDEAFDEDRESLIGSLRENGIGNVCNIGASMESCRTTLAMAEKYPFFYGALGIHPNETKDLTEEDMDWLRKASGSEKIVAIGEIGLDYYWDEPDREIQKKWFVRQLSIAKDTGLPVVIHSRDAAKDTMDIIKAEHKATTGGVIPCFSYGVLTFKNAKKLKEVAEYAPMDRLVLETDCPYLTPVPYRGKRNSSLYLSYVAEALAELKGMERDEVIRVTAENARRLYRL